jgi:hypothetical protein
MFYNRRRLAWHWDCYTTKKKQKEELTMRNEIKSIIASLEKTKTNVAKYLARAENEERIEELENELSCIEDAIETLNNID